MKATGLAELDGPALAATLLDAACGRFRALVRRRLRWIEHLRAQAPPPVGAGGTRWAPWPDDLDTVAAEEEFHAGSTEVAPLQRELARYARARENDRGSRLDWLCWSLGVSEDERAVIEACLAVALDPGLARSCARLHGDPAAAYPSEALVARLYGGQLPLLREGAALLRWQVAAVEPGPPGTPAAIRLDPAVLSLLCGHAAPDPMVAGVATAIAPVPALDAWPVRPLVDRIQRAWDRGERVRVLVKGPRGSGRRAFAGCVARALRHEALALDASAVPEGQFPQLYLRVQRHALLTSTSPVWFGAAVERRAPPAPGVAPLELFVGEMDLTLPPSSQLDEEVTLPLLGIDERRELWTRLVPASRAWPPGQLEGIAERYRVQVGDIAAIARRGISTASEARELSCRLTRGRLGELAQHLECPFGREDLLLPPALNRALDDLLFEARERARFWEQAGARRLFPRGRGLVAMMTGPPGTGKTMAVQVIAAELQLDLFRIDLASSVSKYIGETAKNLRRIFQRASEMNAVLLFDEADALFSKRTEVRDSHDRHANADTNYLLQLLEEFEGVAVLASNKKQNMDPAFVRRIRYVLDFPRLGPEDRLRLWRQLCAELVGPEPTTALLPALESLAATLELSGAQIKLSLLAALFAARQERARLGLEHLLHGVNRELGKEGLAVSPKERERITRGGR